MNDKSRGSCRLVSSWYLEDSRSSVPLTHGHEGLESGHSSLRTLYMAAYCWVSDDDAGRESTKPYSTSVYWFVSLTTQFWGPGRQRQLCIMRFRIFMKTAVTHLGCCLNFFFTRCTAHRKNLDGKNDVCPRHHTHTKVLLETFSSKVLWKEYGIVDDILVSDWLNFNMLFD